LVEWTWVIAPNDMPNDMVSPLAPILLSMLLRNETGKVLQFTRKWGREFLYVSNVNGDIEI